MREIDASAIPDIVHDNVVLFEKRFRHGRSVSYRIQHVAMALLVNKRELCIAEVVHRLRVYGPFLAADESGDFSNRDENMISPLLTVLCSKASKESEMGRHPGGKTLSVVVVASTSRRDGVHVSRITSVRHVGELYGNEELVGMATVDMRVSSNAVILVSPTSFDSVVAAIVRKDDEANASPDR